MTKRQALMLLDTTMLVSFVLLMSWRLSGVTAHEWIGLGLIALIFAHLLVHWGWVESTVARAIKQVERRRFIPLLLNAILFVLMGTALVSGVVISKVVMPNALLPDDYLQWHSLHETSATLALITVGLHMALNWERIRAGARRLLTLSRRPARGIARRWGLEPAVVVRRAAWVLALSAILTGGVWVKTRVFASHPRVLMMFPDGHTELTSPPADIARIRAGSTRPDIAHGGPRFVMALVALTIAGLVGRHVLRLRLDSPGRRAISAASPASRA